MKTENLKIVQVLIKNLKPTTYNPRKWSQIAIDQLTESIKKFGLIDPLLCNSAKGRKNVVIGGHFRLKIAKDLGYTEMPVVYINIPDIQKEKELNIRLNKNLGEFDLNLLADFDESFLSDIGFSSEEVDEIFDIDTEPENFNLEKELSKLKIEKIKMKKGEMWKLGQHRLMIGDSTIEKNILKLMGEEKADMCFTDPPYILNYLKGKNKQKTPQMRHFLHWIRQV